jgi:hypothetical protein
MTKCDKRNKEVGNLYCAKCRAKIEGRDAHIHFEGLIPLLYYDPEKKRYLLGCTVKGCPCNHNGICKTEHLHLPKNLLHEFDGDNIIQQVCG